MEFLKELEDVEVVKVEGKDGAFDLLWFGGRVRVFGKYDALIGRHKNIILRARMWAPGKFWLELSL